MANYTTHTSDKKKKTALTLCCIGLAGIGGLHYFYVGRIGAGLLHLFTAGLFLIGTISDLIKISMGGFRDNVGVPLRG
jgi:restriction system protein